MQCFLVLYQLLDQRVLHEAAHLASDSHAFETIGDGLFVELAPRVHHVFYAELTITYVDVSIVDYVQSSSLLPLVYFQTKLSHCVPYLSWRLFVAHIRSGLTVLKTSLDVIEERIVLRTRRIIDKD